MNEGLPALALAFVGGVLLGLIFFGGLWWTVRWVKRARHPSVLTLVSFTVRGAVLLVGLWWIGAGDAVHMLACGAGIMVARLLLVRWLRSPKGMPKGHIETQWMRRS